MVRQKADDVRKEIEEDKKRFYGDEELGSGSADPETDDDTKKALEDYVGGKVDRGEPFTIQEEVEEDEEERRGR